MNCNLCIIVIYFFYGLAFYSLGLALLVESGRASELGFARSMRILAGFGLLHGVHEWLEMIEDARTLLNIAAFPDWFAWLRLAFLAASLLTLMAFGEHLRFRERPGKPFQWRLTLGVAIWYALSCVIVRLTYNLDEAAWLAASDVLARYVLGIPGTVMACLALWTQRASFVERGMGRFVRDLSIATLALALYGVVGQFFTRPSMIFPSFLLNDALFLSVTGIPVQLFRAAMAAIVAVSMIRVLRALEFENTQRLEAIRVAKLEAERANHQELARLNAELQAANEETAQLLQKVQTRDSLRGELLQRITSAQESERSRVARELHDGTGQTLTALALGLRGLSARCLENPELIAKRLPELESMATTGLGELRQLINDLRPPQLDDMGLAATLRWMSGRFKSTDGPQVHLEIIGESRPMTSEMETVLYRIAQEGLTNVTKHSCAENVWLTLNYDDGPSLMIRDDGVGFDAPSVMRPDGVRSAWGLVGIQERVNLIGASLDVWSAPGEGARLTIRLNTSEGRAREVDHADQSADR